jgi:hypothetical protein
MVTHRRVYPRMGSFGGNGGRTHHRSGSCGGLFNRVGAATVVGVDVDDDDDEVVIFAGAAAGVVFDGAPLGEPRFHLLLNHQL